jgi:hypothetical protein
VFNRKFGATLSMPGILVNIHAFVISALTLFVSASG